MAKKSQKTYISLLISRLLFDLSYSVDEKIDSEKILKPWSIKSLHCNFLVLIYQLMWFLFFKICNIFIHPNLLDPTDPSIAQSMDQLISAQFTERIQSKHILEEYKSSRKYSSHNWHGVGPGQHGCSHANHCFVSARSYTVYCCLVYIYNILDRCMSANKWRAVVFIFLMTDIPSKHFVAQTTCVTLHA